jgi:hypothetical protein
MMKNMTRYEDILSKFPFLDGKDLRTLKDQLSTLIRLHKQLDSAKVQLRNVESDTREYISQADHAKLSAQ